MNKESRIIEQIRSRDHNAIEKIYIQYKEEFLIYASRFSVNDEDAVDIYQDSIVAMYENIIAGKLTSFTSSVKTYLFAIGKYKLYNSLKVKTVTEDLTHYDSLLMEEDNDDFLLREENIEKLQKAYQQLGGKCQQVLKLFYYESRTIEEIKLQLDYSSKDVVKSQKSRCLEQIRKIIFKVKCTSQI